MKEKKLVCKKCNHKWLSRKPNPIRCPRCQSVNWNGDWKAN